MTPAMDQWFRVEGKRSPADQDRYGRRGSDWKSSPVHEKEWDAYYRTGLLPPAQTNAFVGRERLASRTINARATAITQAQK